MRWATNRGLLYRRTTIQYLNFLGELLTKTCYLQSRSLARYFMVHCISTSDQKLNESKKSYCLFNMLKMKIKRNPYLTRSTVGRKEEIFWIRLWLQNFFRNRGVEAWKCMNTTFRTFHNSNHFMFLFFLHLFLCKFSSRGFQSPQNIFLQTKTYELKDCYRYFFLLCKHNYILECFLTFSCPVIIKKMAKVHALNLSRQPI